MQPVLLRSIRSIEKTLRFRAAADGIVNIVFWFIFLSAADFVLDRFFEFPRSIRIALLAVSLLSFAFLFWKYFFSRVFAKLRQEQLAMLLEHFVPTLNESLITSLEYHGRENQAADKISAEENDVHLILMQQTVEQAVLPLQKIKVRRFFRSGRLFLRIAYAAVLIGITAGMCFFFAQSAELWFSRNVLLSQREYPRRSKITVDGFEDGKVRIGRGDSFMLTIRASCDMPLVPDNIRLRTGSPENGYKMLLISQFYTDNKDGADWRVFSYTFNEMLETLSLQVRGADSVLDNLTVEIVPPPLLSNYQLMFKFPEYMKRDNRLLTPGSRTPLPEGTSFELNAVANKPLLKTTVAVNKTKEEPLQVENVPFEKIRYQLDNVRDDTSLEFHLEDIDHLRNRQPLRLDFNVVKDNLPAITARMENIGSAATHNAVLPILGEVSDDYGISSLSFRYSIQKGEKKQEKSAQTETDENVKPIEANAESKTEEGTAAVSIPENTGMFQIDEFFQLDKLQLEAGDKLSLYLEASDKYNLPAKTSGKTEQRIIKGQHWDIEIVTPERLRGLLEVREITFRQRFEVIIGETEKTAALIKEIILEPAEEQIKQANELKPEISAENKDDNKKPSAEEKDNVQQETAQKELAEKILEEKKTAILQTLTAEQAAAGMYNISRSLRDTQKESYDIRTLTEAFRSLRAEMVNNRIFTEEVQKRLDDGIISPMQEVVEKNFAEITERNKSLNETLNIRNQPLRETARKQRAEILEEFAKLLMKLQNIRDKMVSMENYNEAMELLRAIIKQQRHLRQETEEQKNKRLRDLLE